MQEKVDKQQGPTVQHRELYSISYDSRNGKQYGKECVCMYIYIYIYVKLNHLAVQQQLTHCKSTTL